MITDSMDEWLDLTPNQKERVIDMVELDTGALYRKKGRNIMFTYSFVNHMCELEELEELD